MAEAGEPSAPRSPPDVEMQEGPASPSDAPRFVVKYWHSALTRPDLAAVLGNFGTVSNIRVLFDDNYTRKLGAAFVTFSAIKPDQVKKLLALRKVPLLKRKERTVKVLVRRAQRSTTEHLVYQSRRRKKGLRKPVPVRAPALSDPPSYSPFVAIERTSDDDDDDLSDSDEAPWDDLEGHGVPPWFDGDHPDLDFLDEYDDYDDYEDYDAYEFGYDSDDSL